MTELTETDWRFDPAEAAARYRAALGALGWDEARIEEALPAAAVEHYDPAWVAFATASLLYRVATAHACAAETPLAWRVEQADLLAVDADLLAAARLVAAPLGVDEIRQDRRAVWEARRLALLLEHLDAGVDVDPYVAGARAAASAAVALLFGPQRTPTSLEDHIPELGAQTTLGYLDQAEQQLRAALDAVDAARTKLGR